MPVLPVLLVLPVPGRTGITGPTPEAQAALAALAAPAALAAALAAPALIGMHSQIRAYNWQTHKYTNINIGIHSLRKKLYWYALTRLIVKLKNCKFMTVTMVCTHKIEN